MITARGRSAYGACGSTREQRTHGTVEIDQQMLGPPEDIVQRSEWRAFGAHQLPFAGILRCSSSWASRSNPVLTSVNRGLELLGLSQVFLQHSIGACGGVVLRCCFGR